MYGILAAHGGDGLDIAHAEVGSADRCQQEVLAVVGDAYSLAAQRQFVACLTLYASVEVEVSVGIDHLVQERAGGDALCGKALDEVAVLV